MIPIIKPEWRTSTVVAICEGMRQADDFSALPILADALQDADCDDELLLKWLRGEGQRATWTKKSLAIAAITSQQTADAVDWLAIFCDGHDCPGLEEVYAAATDHHEDNPVGEDEQQYYGTRGSSRWDEYLHFDGMDAHGPIPSEFWDKVSLIWGQSVPQQLRSTDFSCSC